jgi:hypothetical protein
VANALCWVPLAAEVDVFNTEIRGCQQLLMPGQPQHSSVVADPAENRLLAYWARQFTDPLNQFALSHR